MRRRANDSGLPNRRMSDPARAALRHAFEGDAGLFQLAVDHGRGARRAQLRIHRQAEDGLRVQLEFALHLGRHGHHAGVVRARADFREPHHVALHEQLDAEHAAAAQAGGDLAAISRALSSARGLIGCGCQDST
jgi:hypothetical protein